MKAIWRLSHATKKYLCPSYMVYLRSFREIGNKCLKNIYKKVRKLNQPLKIYFRKVCIVSIVEEKSLSNMNIISNLKSVCSKKYV